MTTTDVRVELLAVADRFDGDETMSWTVFAQERRRQATMIREIVALEESASDGRECSGANCGGCTAGRALHALARCYLPTNGSG